jgi:hypothetical protein
VLEARDIVHACPERNELLFNSFKKAILPEIHCFLGGVRLCLLQLPYSAE